MDKGRPYYFYENGYLDIATVEWGVPMMVYKIDTPSHVKPQELFPQYGLTDAMETKEHWFLTPVKPKRSTLYFLTNLRYWMGGVSYKTYFLSSVERIVCPQDYDWFTNDYDTSTMSLSEITVTFQKWSIEIRQEV